MDMELTTIMARLGYPKHTDKVYLTLKESREPCSVSAIAAEARISRMVVYRCLVPLRNDGLVATEVVGKRTLYAIGELSALERKMQLTEAAVMTCIENERIRKVTEVPINVRFLTGSEGIKIAFDDVVSHVPKGGTVYRYTSEQSVDEVNSYLAPDYRKRRDAKRLERLVISNPFSKAQKRSRLERFIRTIPATADIFDQNVIQLVYGERVSFIDITKKQVTIIENKALADFQTVIFKQLYKKLDRG